MKAFLPALLLPLALAAAPVESPDGRLAADFSLVDGAPTYRILREGRPCLQPSRLGLVRADADFTTGLRLLGESPVTTVEDRYEILTAKRRANLYVAHRRVFHLENAQRKKLDVIFQVSNDGVAFRYQFPETDTTLHAVTAEASSFHFLPDTRAWLQPMQVARTGFHESNPAYEEYYQTDIPVGQPSTLGAGWVYPALFRSGDTWLLVSESSLPRNYAGTRLSHLSPDGEYTVTLPDPRETKDGLPAHPLSTLPWTTPWRFVVVGDLRTVTESMLGVDLAEPAKFAADATLPGKSSWSWPLLGDDATRYDIQKQFIDYAADMHWPYCLIDALWDKTIGEDKVAELIRYAATKNVRILLWYNSAGDWNGVPFTPRSKLLTHADRVAEFKKLKALGVAGLKIDFFGGDGQPMINYYHDLLEDAAAAGLSLNFHGATLPRGWHRTYPNLMTMEAIKGLEFITFEQRNADTEPVHACMLPFTRNVFDPMDFTPMALDRINSRIQRRTTAGFELAQSVLFTSGIQHYAEVPAGMAKAPDYVREFLRHVPAIWDDVKFLDGFPGKHVVLARRAGNRWYVAGLNGGDEPKALSLDLKKLGGVKSGRLMTDGGTDGLGFRQQEIKVGTDAPLELTVAPTGGFVLVLE